MLKENLGLFVIRIGTQKYYNLYVVAYVGRWKLEYFN